MLVAGALPETALAQEVTVMFASRYLDTSTYNEVFSNEPVLQVEGQASVTDHLYVSAYVYSGFTKPFADKSSEYGFELGGNWDIAERTEVNIAVGRYANYEGRGWHEGDWYGKVGLTHGQATVSASVLSGVTDSVLIRAEYELLRRDRLTVRPSVAYLTDENTFNPALEVNYRLRDKLSFGARAVMPTSKATSSRKLYVALTLTGSF